eukprot:437233_1
MALQLISTAWILLFMTNYLDATESYYSNVGSQTITCNASECNLNCTAKSGCLGLTLNVNMNITTSLDIFCIGTRSCYSSAIYANTVREIYISCAGSDSCEDLTIYANNTQNVTLICNYEDNQSLNDASCGFLTLYANHSQHTDIHCMKRNCYAAAFYLTHAASATFHAELSGSWSAAIYAQHMMNALTMQCDGEGACSYAHIHTNHMEGNLYLICRQLYACQGLRVTGGTMNGNIYVTSAAPDAVKWMTLDADQITGSLDVDCVANHSCSDIDVYCPRQDCNIMCGPFDSPCSGADFHIDSPLHSINLNCTTDNACGGVEFKCNDGDSSRLVYDETTQDWGCGDRDYKCCPYLNGAIECVANQPCQVSCLTDYECQGYIINATKALSLQMTCGGYGSCSGAIVFGPTQNNASFSLGCVSDKSCIGATVQVVGDYHMNAFVLHCGGDQSCQDMDIVFNVSTVSLFNIICESWGDDICTRLNILTRAVIHRLDIQCHNDYTQDRTCSYLDSVFLNTVDSASLVCNGSTSCLYASIDLIVGTDNHSVQCIGPQACNRADFRMAFGEFDDGNVNIYCLNPVLYGINPASYAACGSADFYVTGSGTYPFLGSSVSLNCASRYDCIRIMFNADNLESIDAVCDRQSCLEAVFDVDTTLFFNLACNSYESCVMATVYCPHHDGGVCNVDCVGYESCADLAINANDLCVEDSLNITCHAEVLNGTNVDSYSTCSGLTFDSDSLLSTAYIWNNNSLQYECEHKDDSYCCPYQAQNVILSPNTTISPTDTTNLTAMFNTTIATTDTMQSINTTVTTESPENSATTVATQQSPVTSPVDDALSTDVDGAIDDSAGVISTFVPLVIIASFVINSCVSLHSN